MNRHDVLCCGANIMIDGRAKSSPAKEREVGGETLRHRLGVSPGDTALARLASAGYSGLA